MADNIANDYASMMLNIFTDIVKKYEHNLEVIKQTEDELNDLQHEIELSDPKDMYQGYLIYKEMRNIRIYRRNAKEENELLKDMYDYFTSQSGQAFKSKIQSIQGNSVKVKNLQERRTYKPRQREDLTIVNQHIEVKKTFEEMMEDFNKDKAYVKNGKARR